MPPLGAGFLFMDTRVTTTGRACSGGFLGAGTSPGLTGPKELWVRAPALGAQGFCGRKLLPTVLHGRRWTQVGGAAGCSAFGGTGTGKLMAQL